MQPVIISDHLSKFYGKVKAVEELSLRVEAGEIYAFLGLNGAGKTTTIRMLLGMIKPTSGSVHVLGTKIQPGLSEPWKDVGYLVETPHAYPELTVKENLEVCRRLHPGTPAKDIDQIIGQLNLGEYADRRTGTLSLGNAQRLGLAKALLHHPSLLILDEPANGLDPAGVVEIRELLVSLTKQDGVTVFMSSHILGEVSRLAQRVGIIHNGHLLQELNLEQLGKNRRRRLILKARDIHAVQKVLLDTGYSCQLSGDGSIVIETGDAIENPDILATLLVNSGNPPTHLVVEEEDLEQYFLRLVGLNGVEDHG